MPKSRKHHERRQHPRSGPIHRLDVVLPNCESCAYLVDLSAGGAQIRYSEENAIDGIEQLRIDFPRWVGLGPGVELDGRVVWFGNLDESMFECGFCFDELSPDKRKLIGELAARLALALQQDGLAPLEVGRPELDDEVPLSVFF